MDFTAGQYAQLIIALILILATFLLAYAGPEKPVVKFLLLMIPFQLVTSKYGTLNVGLALLVFMAFMLNRRIDVFPMLRWFGLVAFAYAASLALSPPATYFDHTLYLLAMAANIALFFIVYNWVYRYKDARTFLMTLVWLNVLVDLYCYAQLLIGFESAALFGSSDLALQQNRLDSRLAGPFTAVGMTAEYLVIQIFILFYMYYFEDRSRMKILLASLMAANSAFLVATGNRGGLLVLVLGAFLFFWMFRKEFGGGKLFLRGLIGAAVFGVMGLIVVSYTQFNVLFERFSETEVKEGIPDSRSVIWPIAWERIQEKPFLGHGPRIRLINELERRIPNHEFMPYPHSSVLFVLYTLGIFGLTTFVILFIMLFAKFRGAARTIKSDAFVSGIPKLATLILLIIVIDQLKVSMFRFNLTDYQQYIFALLGGLLAASTFPEKKIMDEQPVTENLREGHSVLRRKQVGGGRVD